MDVIFFFQNLSTDSLHPCSVAKHEKNKEKNRYSNIIPCKFNSHNYTIALLIISLTLTGIILHLNVEFRSILFYKLHKFTKTIQFQPFYFENNTTLTGR